MSKVSLSIAIYTPVYLYYKRAWASTWTEKNEGKCAKRHFTKYL